MRISAMARNEKQYYIDITNEELMHIIIEGARKEHPGVPNTPTAKVYIDFDRAGKHRVRVSWVEENT